MTRPGLHIVTTVSQSLYTLLAGQPARLSRGFDVTLVASPGLDLDAVGGRERVSTYEVHMARSITPVSDLRALWRLYRWFRRSRPLIVQSYTPKAGLLAMMAAWLAKVPIRVHGIVGMPLMEARGLRRHLLALTERTTYVMATHLTCNSRGLRAWVEAHLSPRRPIRVVGAGSINGVDTGHFAPASLAVRQDERRQLGIGAEDTVIVFIGRVVRAKGVEELLQSFDKLRQVQSDLVLVIVGDQEETLDPLSHAAVERLRAGSGVIPVGWREDVRPLLAAADICVLPSYREGLPNTLLEAAASGLPVVASDINGCNEVVQHSRTGVLVPPKNVNALYNGLKELLDPALRQKMGEAAQERVAELYDHERFCDALIGYYQELLASWCGDKSRSCDPESRPPTVKERQPAENNCPIRDAEARAGRRTNEVDVETLPPRGCGTRVARAKQDAQTCVFPAGMGPPEVCNYPSCPWGIRY